MVARSWHHVLGPDAGAAPTTVRAMTAEVTQSVAENDKPVFVEPRWPLALVVGFYLAISVTLRIAEPNRPSVGPHWLVPSIEAGLLLALVAADPSHVSRRARWLRHVGIVLILGLVAVTIISTTILIDDLITGGQATESASLLLSSGALVWLGNAMAFSLVYWDPTAAARWPATRASARIPTCCSRSRRAPSSHRRTGARSSSTTSSSASRRTWRSARPT
jgi:uncharacterized membrane protein